MLFVTCAGLRWLSSIIPAITPPGPGLATKSLKSWPLPMDLYIITRRWVLACLPFVVYLGMDDNVML